MITQNKIHVRHLAEELHVMVQTSTGSENLTVDQLEAFITEQLAGMDFFPENGNQKSERDRIPALLKNSVPPSASSKRMRELAGIPHKGNFI